MCLVSWSQSHSDSPSRIGLRSVCEREQFAWTSVWTEILLKIMDRNTTHWIWIKIWMSIRPIVLLNPFIRRGSKSWPQNFNCVQTQCQLHGNYKKRSFYHICPWHIFLIYLFSELKSWHLLTWHCLRKQKKTLVSRSSFVTNQRSSTSDQVATMAEAFQMVCVWHFTPLSEQSCGCGFKWRQHKSWRYYFMITQKNSPLSILQKHQILSWLHVDTCN